MNSLHITITIIIFGFVLAIIYTLYYFRKEFKVITDHNLYRRAQKYALTPLIVLVVIGICSLVVILMMGYFKFKGTNGDLEFTALGEIGDLFNGLLGPFIALLSVILFYKAYREQIRTNSKNDEFQLLEYCHSRLKELSKEATITQFENNCDIYLQYNLPQKRREIALRRIISTVSEFDNVKEIVSKMELHSSYLKNQYLTVMFDFYYPQMMAISQSIVSEAVVGGQMINVLLGIEGKYNKAFREYKSMLKEEGFV